MSVTAVIPTIPPRAAMLRRAVSSVLGQTRPVDSISIAVDNTHAGSAATRNRALSAVDTEWSCFLDDDDQWKPNHVERLLSTAEATGADVVYSQPEWVGRTPVPGVPQPFSAALLRRGNYIPVTLLARTELVRKAGGFHCPANSDFDDWGCWLALLDEGARFEYLPESTWIWNHHGGNTAGRPDYWR